MPLPLLHSLAGNCRVGVFHAKFCISDRPGPKGASRHRFKLVDSQGVFHVNSTRQQNVFYTRKTITDLWNSMSPFYGYYFELGGIWAIKGRALRNTQLSKLGKCCSTKFSVLVFWPYAAKSPMAFGPMAKVNFAESACNISWVSLNERRKNLECREIFC